MPPAAGDQFGASLAAGDLGTEGYDDLAIGAPYQDVDVTDQGAVYVVSGGDGHVTSRLRKTEQADQFTKAAYDDFGLAVAIGGFTDAPGLAIGAPGRDTQATNAGAVQIFGAGSTISYQETYGAQTHTNH